MNYKKLLYENKLIRKSASLFFSCLTKKTVKGHRNKIVLNGSILNKCRVNIMGNDNTIVISRGALSYLQGCSIYINGNNNNITIGENNRLYNAEFHIEDNNGLISLGNSNMITGKTHLAVIEGSHIKIGNECMFSTNVVFRTGDSHSILDWNTKKRINPSLPITVGDKIWLGYNTTILKGVELKDHIIVGTGAIVTKSFDTCNIVLAGSPAKIVKTDITWIPERIIDYKN